MVPPLDARQDAVLRQRNSPANQLDNEESPAPIDVATSNRIESMPFANSEREKLVVHSSQNYGSFPRMSERRRSDGDAPLEHVLDLHVTATKEHGVSPGTKLSCIKIKAMFNTIRGCFPFCCCQPRANDEENGQQRQAGWISDFKTCCSLLGDILSESNIPWLIYILVLVTVFFMSVWTSESRETTLLDSSTSNSQSGGSILKDSYIMVMLLILMILGIIGEMYCICKKKNRLFVRFTNSHSGHSLGYLLAGVYLFGSGTLFMIVQRLLSYPHADVVYNCFSKNYTSSMGYRKNPESVFCSVDIVYDLMRLIFTATQILFLQGFAKATFRQTAFVKWILFHTIATNICVWITYVVSETGLFRKVAYTMSTITINNSTQPNFGVENEKPDWILEQTDKLTEILIPFTLEYSLIVAGILYAISSNMEKFPQDSRPNDGNKNIRYYQTEDAQRPANVFMGSDLVRIPGRPREVIPRGSQPGLLLGLLFAVILLAAALTLDDHNKSHKDNCLLFFFSFQCLLDACQIIAFVKIIVALQAHTIHSHTLRPDDVLLLIGFVGSIALDLPLGFAAYNAESSSSITITLIATIIMALELLVQVLVILFAQRYDCGHDVNAIKSAKTIRQTSLFLLVTNLSIWALDSFIEIKNSAESSYPFAQEMLGEKNWRSIVAITYPICIFFQFHSAAMLFELWGKFQCPTHYRKETENLVFVV